MIRSFRPVAVALAALALAASASAATNTYQFKTFYDTSTLNPFDKTTFPDPVATLTVSDLATLGSGVKLTLSFNDTAFNGKYASGTSSSVNNLFLFGQGGGTVARDSGAALSASGTGYKAFPVLQEGKLYNYSVQYAGGTFLEGGRSTLTITGKDITAASFASKASPMLELGGVSKPYTGLLGLNSTVHFEGTPVAVPEPGSVMLMGLGLLGVVAAARRRSRQA